MIRCMKLEVLVLIISLSFLFPTICFAQHQYEFTPSVSVSGEYDDNIFLTPDNEVDDYITRVTPSLALNILTQQTNLALRYAPTFVWYDDRDDFYAASKHGHFPCSRHFFRKR